jgi:hypothetical protein
VNEIGLLYKNTAYQMECLKGSKIYYTANKDVLTSYLCMYCEQKGISITKSEFPKFGALALLFAFLLQQIKTTARNFAIIYSFYVMTSKREQQKKSRTAADIDTSPILKWK